MPEGTSILGLDEHTACIFDFAQRLVSVAGRGGVTVRSLGRSRFFATGSTVAFEELWGALPTAHPEPAPVEVQAADTTPFAAQVDVLDERFEVAFGERRADRAVAAALDLEQLMMDWANDTDPLHRGRARSLLRGQIVRLGEEAMEGLRDPADRVRPFVEVLLGMRERARQERQWKLADEIRDALTQAGVELHDTPQGTTWELRPAVQEAHH